MFAMGYLRPGPPEVLVPMEVPLPQVLPTEILVRVHASSINPIDTRTRAGAPTPAAAAQLASPHVLGWDVSGVVVEVGPGVHRFEVGDEVFGLPWFPRAAGANAEFVAAPSRHFARKPARMDHDHAAALPLAGLTAWQALNEVAAVQPGQRVLIHAAGGGVGHIAVQVAKALGAYVIGTARESQHAWLRVLGADELIDFHTHRFEDQVAPVDIVLDLVGGFGDGGDTQLRSLDVLRRGGVLVRVAPGEAPELESEARLLGVRTSPELLVEPDYCGLENLVKLVDNGQLETELHASFELRDLVAAHRRAEEGGFAGKIVIRHDAT